MKTGPRFPPFDAARRRLIRQLLPGAADVRRTETAAAAPRALTAAPRIRPTQFIGVIPPDIAAEKAR